MPRKQHQTVTSTPLQLYESPIAFLAAFEGHAADEARRVSCEIRARGRKTRQASGFLRNVPIEQELLPQNDLIFPAVPAAASR